MRQLKDVQVDGMALVRRPANKKRFLTKKSEEAAVAADTASQINAPSAAVSDAIDAIKLAKGESADGHEALHTAAHMLAGRSDITLQDLMAYGEALGLEDVAKAEKKKPAMDMDDEEEGEDEADEEEEEEDGEDKKSKKMPAFLKDKLNKSQQTAAQTASKGAPMAATGKESRNFVSKSDHEQLLERLTKSEQELADIRGREAMRVEKAANEEAYTSLQIDHDALAGLTASLRKSDKDKLKALETILKSANEQVRVAKASGGSPFRPRAVAGGATGASQSVSTFNELVKKHMSENPNVSQPEAITAVAKSADGLAAYRASKGAN